MNDLGGYGQGPNVVPGWYPDPYSPPIEGRLRFWDGTKWTDQMSAPKVPSQSRNSVTRWLFVGTAGVIIIGLVVAVGVIRGQPVDDQVIATDQSSQSDESRQRSGDTPSETPSPTSGIKAPTSTVGKPVEAALARYFDAYVQVWDFDDLVAGEYLWIQLEPRAEDLRLAFERLVAVSDSDPGANDSATNFGALLTAIELQVRAVEEAIAEYRECTDVWSSAVVDCELDVSEAIFDDLTRADDRVTVALELVNLPDIPREDPRTVRFDVAVGECFIAGSPYKVVDCSDEHEGEVFGEYRLRYESLAPFPGRDVITEIAERECERKFSGYVGVDYELSELSIAFVYPSPETWRIGERSISCVAQLDNGTLTESVRGSLR